ncbi:uncharacterized protein LOC128718056 [Anopheles marshallii]|uniref:uncharacterized protein LOC128718056 n=1 Tax=Anopheles marshallii TaxID=1521116 RepID=UPI00237A4177|nr:uncharacterized protein LOC128718056 [Anopheles marshallii]
MKITDETSVNVVKLCNLLLRASLPHKPVTKKKLKKRKVQQIWKEETIDETSDNVGQLCNLLPTENLPHEPVTKKKHKKRKVQQIGEEEIIDETSVNGDQFSNLQPTASLSHEEEIKKKKKIEKFREEKTIDETSDNVDKRRNSSPTVDSDNANHETNVLNGDVITEEVPKKKKIKQTMEKNREAEDIDETSFNIDQFRNPFEGEEHWCLRRAFLEKNQQVLSPDELICLAQVYMNVELLGCNYAAETMEMVAKLSEGLGQDYQRAHAFMLKPTCIFASDAAACKVRKLNLSDVVQHNRNLSDNTVVEDTQHPVPGHVLNWLRNDLIIFNNNLQQTMQIFNNLNNDLKMNTSTRSDGNGMFEGLVKVGPIEIAKAVDHSAKHALMKASKNAIEFLSQYCYSLKFKYCPADLDGADVVTKSAIAESPHDRDQEESPSLKLDAENIGFKLLEKLGWSGGSLGVRGDGIVDPVAVDQKEGREGLGLRTEDGSNVKLSRDTIRQMMEDFRDGQTNVQKIVFSSECSKEDRKLIHALANQMKLRSRSYGKEGEEGGRYLVVTRKYQLRPTELLRKILVEKDPFFCQTYDVTYPTELN